MLHGDYAANIGPLKKVLVKGGKFWITTYQKIDDPTKPYIFYIEGDGGAFNDKYRVSNNPTPKHLSLQRSFMFSRFSIDETIDRFVTKPCMNPINMRPRS